MVADLCVSAGVPVWVVENDSVGSSQVDSQTSDFSGQQEDKNGFVLWERRGKKITQSHSTFGNMSRPHIVIKSRLKNKSWLRGTTVLDDVDFPA